MASDPRSKRAIATGFVVFAVLSLAGFIAARVLGLLQPGVVPPEHDLFLFILCLTFFAMIGGYVTARLAPYDPRNHTISLGVVLTIPGFIGMVAQMFTHYGPDWFGWLLLLSGLPGAFVGGKIHRNRD